MERLITMDWFDIIFKIFLAVFSACLAFSLTRLQKKIDKQESDTKKYREEREIKEKREKAIRDSGDGALYQTQLLWIWDEVRKTGEGPEDRVFTVHQRRAFANMYKAYKQRGMNGEMDDICSALFTYKDENGNHSSMEDYGIKFVHHQIEVEV